MQRRVEGDGFAVVPSCLDDETVQRLCYNLSDTSYGMRNLLAVPVVRELAVSATVRTLAEAVLGKKCLAVKGTFFNKTHKATSRREWRGNGPLRVIPGSHGQGRFSAEEVAEWSRGDRITCTVPRGGALLMRPLLLHASSACLIPKPRRVIHLEFAAEELPGGLKWFDRVG